MKVKNRNWRNEIFYGFDLRKCSQLLKDTFIPSIITYSYKSHSQTIIKEIFIASLISENGL